MSRLGALVALALGAGTACGGGEPITAGSPDEPVLVINSDATPLVGPTGQVVGIYSEIFEPVHGIEVGDPWTGRVWGNLVRPGLDWVKPTIGADGAILYGYGGRLIALTESGEPWWEVELGAPAQTPVSIGHDGTIYVADGAGLLHAFTASGDPMWAVWLGDVIPRGIIAIDRNGRLFVHGLVDEQLDSELIAVSLDGQVLWREPNNVPVLSAYIDNDGNVITNSFLGDGSLAEYDPANHELRSRNPETGELNWTYDAEGQANGIHVRPDGDILITTVGLQGEGSIQGINPRNGNRRFYVEPGYGHVGPGVIADDGRFYFGCGAQVCSANASNGSVGGTTWYTQEFRVSSPPAVHQGLLIANGSGVIYAWELGGNVHTEDRGWPRGGGDNATTGAAP